MLRIHRGNGITASETSPLGTWVVLYKTLLGKSTDFCRSKDELLLNWKPVIAVIGKRRSCWLFPSLVWSCCFCWAPLAFLQLSLLVIAGPVVWLLPTINIDNYISLITDPYLQPPAPEVQVKKTFVKLFKYQIWHKGSSCSVTCVHLIGSSSLCIFLLVAFSQIIFSVLGWSTWATDILCSFLPSLNVIFGHVPASVSLWTILKVFCRDLC